MRRMLCAAVIGCLLLPRPAHSQEWSVRSDIENLFSDAGHVLSAPVHATTSDYATAGIVVAGVGLLMLVDEPVQDWLRRNPGSLLVKALGPVREYSPGNLLGRMRQFLVPL